MNRLKMTPEEIQAQQDAINSEAINKVKRFAGILGGSPGQSQGSEIEQRAVVKNEKKQTPAPYETNYPSGNYGESKKSLSIPEADSRLNDAYRMQQMKQLEDLEQIGAFEDPESDVNKRAKILRGLLGK